MKQLKYSSFNKVFLGLTFSLVSACSNSDTLIQNQNQEVSALNLDEKNSLNIPSLPSGNEPNFETFFSYTYDGDSEQAKNYAFNPDKQLIKTIGGAKDTLDVCAYIIDSPTITDAIIKAHKSGVRVRVVIDSESNKKDSVIRIKEDGIPVVEDNRSAIMHNKFVVVDKNIVWTGSFNLTDSASWKHNDNAIKINNKFLARNYTSEFEEMFLEKRFGRTSPNNVTNRIVRVGNKYIKVFFAPEDNVAKAIVDEIKKAQKEIKFMSYSFTHEEIEKALIERAKKGVKISGIFEKVGSGQNSDVSVFSKLRTAGIDLYIYKNPSPNQAFMHHKVIIVDGKTVTTGSYNFTYNASKDNDENMLVISSPDVAHDYLKEFDRLKEKQATLLE